MSLFQASLLNLCPCLPPLLFAQMLFFFFFGVVVKFFLVSEELFDPVEEYRLEWDTGMLFTETNYIAQMIYC